MPPIFSIIIPVYNVAPYLRECLDSVLAQTYTDWEAICVDDGSTDESDDILDEFAKKDKRFCVIHQKNTGVSGARNTGIEHATGKYVTFIDSDDWVAPDFLATLMSHDEDLVCLSEILVRPNGDREQRHHSPVHYRMNPTIIAEQSLNDNIGYMPNKRYRLDIIKKYGIRFDPEIHYGEDTLFTVQYAMKAQTLAVEDNAQYFYRTGLSGTLSSVTLEKFDMIRHGQQKLAKSIFPNDKEGQESYFLKRMKILYTGYLLEYVICGRSIFCHPSRLKFFEQYPDFKRCIELDTTGIITKSRLVRRGILKGNSILAYVGVLGRKIQHLSWRVKVKVKSMLQ